MTEQMVSLKGICKRFGELEVLKGVDIDVGRGEVVCIPRAWRGDAIQ